MSNNRQKCFKHWSRRKYFNFDLDLNDQKSQEVLLGCSYLNAKIKHSEISEIF